MIDIAPGIIRVALGINVAAVGIINAAMGMNVANRGRYEFLPDSPKIRKRRAVGAICYVSSAPFDAPEQHPYVVGH